MLTSTADLPGGDACAEANHRIANHLSLVVSILHLHKEALVKTSRFAREDASAVLEDCGRRIESIARVHRLLAQQRPQAPRVELGQYLRETAEGILAGVSTRGKHVLRFDCPAPLEVEPEQAVTLGLLAGELVTNAVKYSHPSGVRGLIWIDCRRQGDGAIVVEVCDDGVGLPEGFDPTASRSSVGFRLLSSLIDRLGAKVEFDSSSLGLSVKICVPAER